MTELDPTGIASAADALKAALFSAAQSGRSETPFAEIAAVTVRAYLSATPPQDGQSDPLAVPSAEQDSLTPNGVKLLISQMRVCADVARPSPDDFTYLNTPAREMLRAAVEVLTRRSDALSRPKAETEAPKAKCVGCLGSGGTWKDDVGYDNMGHMFRHKETCPICSGTGLAASPSATPQVEPEELRSTREAANRLSRPAAGGMKCPDCDNGTMTIDGPGMAEPMPARCKTCGGTGRLTNPPDHSAAPSETVEELAKGKSRPIAIWHKGDAEAYYRATEEERTAWNAYAQSEADAFDNDPRRDSYDSTAVFAGHDRDGRVTNWCPPLYFPEWLEHRRALTKDTTNAD